MIRSEQEYGEAVTRIQEAKCRIDTQRAELKKLGLTAAELKRALDPVKSFYLQLEEEVAAYERLRRGEIDEISSLRSLGTLLISSRIARGLNQRELAESLGVHESQVSRDERNEYHGVSLERAARILDALGVQVRLSALVSRNSSTLT